VWAALLAGAVFAYAGDTRLTGDKEGCNNGNCAVLLNGVLVNACLALGGEVDGARVTPVGGIAPRIPFSASSWSMPRCNAASAPLGSSWSLRRCSLATRTSTRCAIGWPATYAAAPVITRSRALRWMPRRRCINAGTLPHRQAR